MGVLACSSPGPWTRSAALAAVLLAALPARPLGQKKDAPKKAPPAAALRAEPWLGEFEGARTSVRERNTPLVILALLEGETTSDRVREELYRGKDFLAALQGAQLVLINDGDHPQKKIQVPDPTNPKSPPIERSVCSVYETPSCADHKRSWNRVYQEFQVEGEMRLPQLIVLGPAGAEHGRLVDEIQRAQAVALVDAAKAAAGKPLTEEALRDVQDALRGMQALERAQVWLEVLSHARRVLAITEKSAHADEARGGEERALTALRADLAAQRARVEAGELEAGYARLRGLRGALSGTPLEKESADLVSALERDKRFKDALAAIRRREEADLLWKECEAALAEGKTASAERLAARLLQRFADTPAAEKAKARFPELAETAR